MEALFKKFGLYTVDPDYLRCVRAVDQEVDYIDDARHDHKPFLGIVASLGGHDYFVPLTSSKEKHISWRNSTHEHLIVSAVIDRGDLVPGDIYRDRPGDQVEKIYSVLDYRKMIPIPKGVYNLIDFNKEPDRRYATLLMKEYLFCKAKQDVILQRLSKLYTKQIETGHVFQYYCDFKKLEAFCDLYTNE